MRTLSLRTAAATVAVLLVTVGAFATPAAAIRTTGDSSSLNISIAVQTGYGGGSGSMECTSDGLPSHHCDKEGELTAGPVSVDYDGYNYGNQSEMTGGGGDEVTVNVSGQEATVEFDCDFRAGVPSGNPCPASINSSQTDDERHPSGSDSTRRSSGDEVNRSGTSEARSTADHGRNSSSSAHGVFSR